MPRLKSASSFNKRWRTGLAVLVGMVFLMATSSLVSARPFRMGKLPDKGATFGCGTCHVNQRGGGEKNAFGRDYQSIGIKAGEKYSEELGKKDSDGDGFTNDQEFDAGTHPGKSESKP